MFDVQEQRFAFTSALLIRTSSLNHRLVHSMIYLFLLQFVRTLARFRPISNRDVSKNTHLNSREEKLRFAFKMYDINDDDKIHHNEILDVLHMMVRETKR